MKNISSKNLVQRLGKVSNGRLLSSKTVVHKNSNIKPQTQKASPQKNNHQQKVKPNNTVVSQNLKKNSLQNTERVIQVLALQKGDSVLRPPNNGGNRTENIANKICNEAAVKNPAKDDNMKNKEKISTKGVNMQVINQNLVKCNEIDLTKLKTEVLTQSPVESGAKDFTKTTESKDQHVKTYENNVQEPKPEVKNQNIVKGNENNVKQQPKMQVKNQTTVKSNEKDVNKELIAHIPTQNIAKSESSVSQPLRMVSKALKTEVLTQSPLKSGAKDFTKTTESKDQHVKTDENNVQEPKTEVKNQNIVKGNENNVKQQPKMQVKNQTTVKSDEKDVNKKLITHIATQNIAKSESSVSQPLRMVSKTLKTEVLTQSPVKSCAKDSTKTTESKDQHAKTAESNVQETKTEVKNQNVVKGNESNVKQQPKMQVKNQTTVKSNEKDVKKELIAHMPTQNIAKSESSVTQPLRMVSKAGSGNSNNNQNTTNNINQNKSQISKSVESTNQKATIKENKSEKKSKKNSEEKLVGSIVEKTKPEKQNMVKVTSDIITVLTDLKNSINLVKGSLKKDSYSDVVPQLEKMCQKHNGVFHRKNIPKVPQKSSSVKNQQNTSAKTTAKFKGKSSVSLSNTRRPSQSFKGSLSRARESVVNRENYNPLGVIKDEVEQAIKRRKTFAIRGFNPAIRRALLSRGWIEKYVDKTQDVEIKKYQYYSITELVELLRIKEIAEICKKVIKSKMLMNHQVDFFWDITYDAFKECPDTTKFTLINKFRRDVFSYTNKEGLCEAAKHSHWFRIPGVANINHPRSYTLTKTKDAKEFITDFNLTAATSLLKWIVRNHDTKECLILSETGKVPLKVFEFAVTECYKFIKKLKHEDIDKEIANALDYDWHEFLEYFYKTVHVGKSFKAEKGSSQLDMVRKSRYILNILKDKWPYLEMDGMMNIWILKPTNSSQGIGIHICRTLEYILNIVKKNANKRYIIQKYIEKPFLIHDTKFDIRQWFLISNANPLTIWMYRQCYLRFSSETYNLRKLHESIHLTNNSVQCRYQRKDQRTLILPSYNMWDSTEFKAYLSDIGYPKAFRDIIYPGMKESITAAVLMHQEKIDKRKNCFELYGADFILTEDFKPWLLEINSRPAMQASTPITQRMCPQVLEDVIKVVVDFDRDSKANTGNFELIYKQRVASQPKMVGALAVSGVPLQQNYFYNPPFSSTGMASKNTAVNLKDRYSLWDIAKELNPRIDLTKVGDNVRNTLETLINLLKKEQLKRQQRESKSVETRSLCCVFEKIHSETQTEVLEVLFKEFLNAQNENISDDSKIIRSQNLLSCFQGSENS